MVRVRYLGIVLVIAGLWASSWGVWSSFNRQKPIDLLGSAMAPLGVVVLVLGGVLIAVPQFFSGC